MLCWQSFMKRVNGFLVTCFHTWFFSICCSCSYISASKMKLPTATVPNHLSFFKEILTLTVKGKLNLVETIIFFLERLSKYPELYFSTCNRLRTRVFQRSKTRRLWPKLAIQQTICHSQEVPSLFSQNSLVTSHITILQGLPPFFFQPL